MQKKRRIILFAIVIALFLPGVARAKSQTKEVNCSAALSKWIVDERSQMIYGLSKYSKKVMFFNAKTLEQEGEVLLGLQPVDMAMDDSRLYISLRATKKIIVIDLATRECMEPILPKKEPESLFIIEDTLYYTHSPNLMAYDLKQQTETKLPSEQNSSCQFAYDEEQGMLYAGEHGSSGSNMYYYDLKQKKLVSQTNYNSGYGFSFPKGGVHMDGNYVYYASHKFDKNDATRIIGDYENGQILQVTDELVYTTTGVYEKESHIKLGEYKEAVTYMYCNDTVIYQYNANTAKIKRIDTNGEKITSKNVVALLDGKKSEEIPSKRNANKVLNGLFTLEMKNELDDWLLDEESGMLLASSSNNKALFFINEQTLNLENTIILKSAPTHMLLEDGLLYVALADAHYIQVIDVKNQEIVDTFYTISDPYMFVKEGKNIYYTERSQHCYLYKYDIAKRSDNKLMEQRFYQPAIELNEEDHILYIGESSLSGSDLVYYSTTEERIIGKSDYDNGYGFPHPKRKIRYDGEYVYYAKFVFDKYDPINIIRDLSDMPNQEEDKKQLELSYNGKKYVYVPEKNMISKMDTANIAFVQFDSKGGTHMDMQMADTNELLPYPSYEPKRKGFTFAGWYREEQCETPWDFELDLLYESTTLYAKWIANPKAPLNAAAKAVSKSGIKVSWSEVEGAKGYEIYRYAQGSLNYELVCETSTPEYLDKDIVLNKTYYYKVRAYRMNGKKKEYSPYSQTANGTVMLPAPKNLKVTKQNKTTVKIIWSKVTGSSSYEVYRATSKNGTYKKIKVQNGTSYKNTGLKKKQTYYYKVRAYRVVNNNGKKVYSGFTPIVSIKM